MVTTMKASERIGLHVNRASASDLVELIEQAEAAGVGTVWMTMSSTSSDPLTVYAAAATRTSRVKMGSAVVPAFPRHPLILASQALVLDDLAPGRFRLGVGTSHRARMVDAYHLPFDRPLARLREYVEVLRPLLREGSISYQGDYYEADARLPGALDVPVLVSALRENAFEMAGELTDGAISWVCPVHYLKTRAIPAMQRGAERAGRETPPLIAHISVAMQTDRAAVHESARRELARYAGSPFYQYMFAEAGFPIGPDNSYSEDALDNLVLSGDDDAVGEQLHALLDDGFDELLVMLIPGPDQSAEEQRLLQIIERM